MELPAATKIKVEVELDQTLWADYQDMMKQWKDNDPNCKHTLDSNIENFMRSHLLHFHVAMVHEKYKPQ